MSFDLLRRLRAVRARRLDPAVDRDATELLQLWGAAAHERAADLSRQEDWGFVPSETPGHWWRVRREIGRRIGARDSDPAAEFAA